MKKSLLKKSNIAIGILAITVIGFAYILQEKFSRQQSDFANINKLLFVFSRQCNLEQVEEAIDTFLEIQQEWERKDVLFSRSSSPTLDYYPSDSLKRLGELLLVFSKSPTNKSAKIKIMQEIKSINAKVDRFTLSSEKTSHTKQKKEEPR
ncbi:hypothetical protein [Dyadobacter aurulentus]|uniref:hypothetical protein n=1 Tax=Dyadobacter sp. UC 10 TaxID=2605428 RepID=UPI0011F0C30C|nr:hypothetical protein [Dyadobacter sp. UC 10]KAA0989801.1 hypothetical protein FXO21_06285 [Dyadobacter sp. UC 10]